MDLCIDHLYRRFYFTDGHAIRRVDMNTGEVKHFAGGLRSYHTGYVNGIGTIARFYDPRGLSLLSNGDIVVADCFNDCIRRIT